MSVPTGAAALVGSAAGRARLSPLAGGVVGKAAEAGTLVLLAMLVPRLLGPVDYGHLTIVLTVVLTGTTALALGGTPMLSRFVPAAPPAQRLALARALGLRLAASRLGQLAVLAVVAVVLATIRPAAFPPLFTALTVVALGANVLATVALQVGLGLGRTVLWNLRWPLQNGVLVALVLLLYPLLGRTGAVLAVALSGGCALAVGAVAARGVLAARGPAPSLPSGALRFARSQGAGWVLLQLAQRGGVLAVALLAGDAVETGYAGLAIGVASAGTYAVLQLFVVSLPFLSLDADVGGSDAADVRMAHAEARLRRLAGLVLTVLLPGLLVGAAVLEDAVVLVFGVRYAAAAPVFAPMLALVVLAPVSALLLQVAALRVRADATLAGASVGAAVFALVAVLAVPGHGALGGAVATLSGAVATTVVMARQLPGAAGCRLGLVSAGGAAAALVLVASA